METIFSEHIDIDIQKLKSLLLKLEKELLVKFEHLPSVYSATKGSKISGYFKYYNLNDINEPILQELFTKIKEKMHQKGIDTTDMFLHSWLNVHRKGENLFWHSHFPKLKNYLHGYFCVEVEPSKTLYAICGEDDIIEVNNTNSAVVVGCIRRIFLHKVTKWEQECERITIGFNYYTKNSSSLMFSRIFTRVLKYVLRLFA
jgi:hypothetical protein